MRYSVRRVTLDVCLSVTRLFLVATIALLGFSVSSVQAQSLPSGWASANVGAPAYPGTVSHVNGVFTIEGSGNITDPNDQFMFVYRQITGDTTLVARVGSFENTHFLAKSGVMIRETLSGNSRYAASLVTPGYGLLFQSRTATGGATAMTQASGAAPVWLRIERRGSSFTASRSSDGASWTQIGSTTISMASTVYVGLAVSSRAETLATATFSSVTGTSVTSTDTAGGTTSQATTLPSGWANADIGSPAVGGVAVWDGSAYTIRGAGADVWGTSDQFHYLYRQASGDVDVVARVESLAGPDVWSKAGVMIRPSLAANAANAYALVSAARGLSFQYRPGTGLTTAQAGAASGAAPAWLKLERRGSSVTAFRSSDGVSWSIMGSTTLALGSSFYVGVAVTSHNVSSTARAVARNVSVTSANSPTPTPTPPTVSLASPTAGATYAAPANVPLAASASDSDNGVAQVEFYANGTLIGTDATSPYGYTWYSVPAGTYTLTAVARDNAGATATSAARSITVSGSTSSNVPPTVSLTAPASGSTYAAPASVTIAANAADSDGAIARVDFYAGSTLVGSDTSSPYSVTWSNAPAGTFALTAVARDNAGATTTSGARSIAIGAAAMPNRVAFTPSPDHATVTRYSLDIFTSGANPATATPLASQNLGRPAVVNGECTVDISGTISGLPGGNYFATVVAISSTGTSTRATSAVFAR